MTSHVAPSQSTPWPWPPSLDALAAAPAHHRLVFENAQVRVLDTRVPPGETVPLHTHQWPSVLHVLTWSDCVRRDANGNIEFDTRLNIPSVLQLAEPEDGRTPPPQTE